MEQRSSKHWKPVTSPGFAVRSLSRKQRKGTWHACEWNTININEEENICSSAWENSTLPLLDKGWEYLLIATAQKQNLKCLNI